MLITRSAALVALLVLSTATLFSQTRFHAQVGTNFTGVTEDYEDGEIEGKFGYQVGFNIHFGDEFYIAPGVHFFSHQTRVKFNEIGDIFPDYDVEFRGIRVPVMIGGDLIEDEDWGLRLYGGPNASFVLNTNDNFPGFEDDIFEDVLWGVNGGVGVDLGIFTIDLSQEVRLNSVFKDDDINFKNHITHLTVGLLF